MISGGESIEARPIGFGVVGLGLMGERHCRIIRAVDGARLVGVCDASAEVAERLSAEFDATAFSDYEAMLDCADVDAVVICLPSALHGGFGIRAAQAGKHVVTEKPIDSDFAMAERLVRECDAREVLCAVVSQNRYSPGLRAMKWAVESGAIGQPVLARATVKWFRHDEYYTGSHWRGRREGENGGVLINQAVHSIDTLQWLFGEPERVAGFSHGSRPGVMETEDSAVAVMQWGSGLVASLEASTSAAPGFDEAYELHSPMGSIRVVKGRVDYWWQRDGLALPEFCVEKTGGGAAGLEGKLALFARQYENVIGAVRGDVELGVRAEEAVGVVRTIQRIYEACEKGNT